MSIPSNGFFTSFTSETRGGWIISCASVIWVLSLGVARAEDLTQREVIRSVMPDGSVQYGDAPADGAADTQRIQLKISAPDAGAAKQAADEAHARRSQLLRDADLRAARRRVLDDKIAAAARQLADAVNARERGQSLAEGDRQGRRLTDQFLRRQEALADDVKRARIQFDRLVQERSSL